MQQLNTEAKTIPFKIVMWTVLSGDFDTDISGEKCFRNVQQKTKEGSIVVFHDSAKAFERMQYALPKTLEYFAEKGFRFEAIGKEAIVNTEKAQRQQGTQAQREYKA